MDAVTSCVLEREKEEKKSLCDYVCARLSVCPVRADLFLAFKS